MNKKSDIANAFWCIMAMAWIAFVLAVPFGGIYVLVHYIIKFW